MRCIRDNIFISFDPLERFRRSMPDGSTLIIPEFWDHVDDYGQKSGKMDRELNELKTNPQIGYVIHPNDKFKFKPGDKIFMHYLSIDYRCTVGDQVGAFTNANDIFFTDNGEIEMCDGVYLGEQLIDEIPRTAGGIWLDFMERKKECHIKLTHVPNGSELKPGDVVFSIDGAQYPIFYNNQKYIKLLDSEIVGLVEAA
jgi:hypothetical protein